MKTYYAMSSRDPVSNNSYNRYLDGENPPSARDREKAIDRADLKLCPLCQQMQAFTLEADSAIDQGGIRIHIERIYCLHCEEAYAIPL